MAEVITVSIVDACGNSTTVTATPPASTDRLRSVLAFGHGAGDLLKGENEIVLDETSWELQVPCDR